MIISEFIVTVLFQVKGDTYSVAVACFLSHCAGNVRNVLFFSFTVHLYMNFGSSLSHLKKKKKEREKKIVFASFIFLKEKKKKEKKSCY